MQGLLAFIKDFRTIKKEGEHVNELVKKRLKKENIN